MQSHLESRHRGFIEACRLASFQIIDLELVSLRLGWWSSERKLSDDDRAESVESFRPPAVEVGERRRTDVIKRLSDSAGKCMQMW